MITKTYKADSEVSLNIRKGDTYRRVSFRPVAYGMSVHTTSDIAEQNALENHPFFGSMFRLDSEVRTGEDEQPVTEEEVIPEIKELKEVPEIDNCPDAKHFLINLGWEGKATSKAALKSIAAEKYGYDFINLK